MATIESRYQAATEYVRRAIRTVETGALRTPASAFLPIFATEVYAGQVKTEHVRNELAHIEDRWLRAANDIERARVARDAELLADRTEENLPSAPTDWKRTNLTVGEVARTTIATTYAGEVEHEAAQAWGWMKGAADRAKDDAFSFGRLLLVGGALALGFKIVDYLQERERGMRAVARLREGERGKSR